MSDIDLVIFDCDGVLVDTERIAVRVDVRVLAELGWTMTEAEVVERFMGRSDAHFVSEVEAHLGRPLPGDWETPYQSWYRRAFEAELTPVDGIVEALDAITLPTCVASSGTHERIRFTLGLTGLYPRFDGRIFSVQDVVNGKPAPDLFLHAAKSMGVEPARCIVVEDSRYGVAAARAAGMRALGYAGGLTPRAWLEGPDTIVFDDMRQLPGLLA
ncbi:MAG: HAD-IA family hydrolase [Candidatus Rokubacteria bacterium]|nr:HAD-IA family hydrolase [Candidatus Rokubacteria bacterium]